jgi:hypothetical protein
MLEMNIKDRCYMSNGQLILQIVCYGFVCWLGFYMIHRDARNLRLFLTGLGLIVYAICLGSSVLIVYPGNGSVSLVLSIIKNIAFFLPLVFLLGALLLTRSENGLGSKKIWIVLPICWYTGIGLWFILLSHDLLSNSLLIVNGLLLLVEGVVITASTIKDRGEAWLPEFFRSLDYSVFYTLLFSGLVVFAIVWGTGMNFSMLCLLLAMVALSIVLQVFSHSLRTLLDNIAFVTFPKLREESAQLRMVDHVTSRVDETAIPHNLDDDHLFQFTRRALSSFGDLQRLASNPLTQIDLIDRRLNKRGGTVEVIERAIELKAILTESIEQLKPRQGEYFGTTDEWRYYNALYFPYIVGMKPYNRRYSEELLDDTSREALDWFRTYVPERTLYNWQNAGARLVALRLKEKTFLG